VFAIVGRTSGEILSYRGRMVVHHDRAELEFLFPGEKIVMLNGYSREEVAQKYGRPAMHLKDHPDMDAVQWPLDRKRFLV